ncbi:Uu.00g016250.m01.CDS01 [Anthostomella pinea]|uniref:Uu.00g016250.m01.CDS01 n=1 Tax=Anthostomella pinea TaxID=933095 RepID=A0AAI8YQK1_9PEZI|nr:Uu.00g016250.m01.CDS01 [Anthostomella pinea]
MAHVVRELDLNAYYGSHTMMDKMNVVPGLKTSTAFFTFLRANLVVNPSAVSTPTMEPTSSPLLPLPSASPLVTVDGPPQNGHGLHAVPDDLPPLAVGPLTSEPDKVAALQLIADSIAQQRQSASRNLIFHPYLLGLFAAGLGLAYQYSWRLKRDLGTALLLHSGVIMIYLLTIRYFTGEYVQVAENLKWSWLVHDRYPDAGNSSHSNTHSRTNSRTHSRNNSNSSNISNHGPDEDTIIGVHFGSALIGALVLRLEPSPSVAGGGGGGSNRKRARSSVLRGGRGVIRAWTVKLKYRGKGVGADLLHEAVRATRERCGRDAGVGFAKEHANSTMVLPEVFNGPFRRSEQRAARALEDVLGEWEGGKRRRRN